MNFPAMGEAKSIHRPENNIVPAIESVDTPMADAIAFLSMRSRELDIGKPDPKRKGFDIVLVGDFHESTVTMFLQNVL